MFSYLNAELARGRQQDLFEAAARQRHYADTVGRRPGSRRAVQTGRRWMMAFRRRSLPGLGDRATER